MSTEADEYQKTIRDMITRLTALESLLSEQKYNLEGSSSMGVYLNRFAQDKQKLFELLKKTYERRQEMVKNSGASYIAIRGLKNTITDQVAESQDLIKSLEDEIAGKKRMGEITDYKYNKYISYKRILKIISFTSIGIISISLLIKTVPPIRPFGIGFIVLLGTYMLWQLGYILIDNFRRDDKYWHKFKAGSVVNYDMETGDYSESKWDSNMRNINKLMGNLGPAGACQAATDAAASAAESAADSATEGV